MTHFTATVLNYLLAALAAAGIATGLCFLLRRPIKAHWEQKHPGREFPGGRILLGVLTVIYLAVLCFVTLLGRAPGYSGYANFHLLRAFRDAWNHFPWQDWGNVLINIAMFVPLGLLLPLLSEKLRRWWSPLAAGVALSGLIEGIQYFTGRGLMDVDDLLCNSLGAFLGGCLILSFLHFRQGKKKQFAACLVFPALLLLFLAGTFCAYYIKPYGNLPDAPSYRVPMKNVRLTLSCTLPEQRQQAMLYRAPGFTKESGDAFGEAFSEAHDLNFTQKDYYEGSALYSDEEETCYLYLLYRDGSWLYQARGFREPGCQDFDRDQLLKTLDPFQLDIPNQAMFTLDEPDCLMLSVSRFPGEGGIYDGSVRCKLDPAGRLLEMQQFLLFYEEYQEETLCSPREAYEKLQRGDFTGPDWYPGMEPDNYEITGWQLQYRTDTKGLYRPVYVFGARTDGTEISGGLLVTAQ